MGPGVGFHDVNVLVGFHDVGSSGDHADGLVSDSEDLFESNASLPISTYLVIINSIVLIGLVCCAISVSILIGQYANRKSNINMVDAEIISPDADSIKHRIDENHDINDADGITPDTDPISDVELVTILSKEIGETARMSDERTDGGIASSHLIDHELDNRSMKKSPNSVNDSVLDSEANPAIEQNPGEKDVGSVAYDIMDEESHCEALRPEQDQDDEWIINGTPFENLDTRFDPAARHHQTWSILNDLFASLGLMRKIIGFDPFDSDARLLCTSGFGCPAAQPKPALDPDSADTNQEVVVTESESDHQIPGHSFRQESIKKGHFDQLEPNETLVFAKLHEMCSIDSEIKQFTKLWDELQEISGDVEISPWNWKRCNELIDSVKELVRFSLSVVDWNQYEKEFAQNDFQSNLLMQFVWSRFMGYYQHMIRLSELLHVPDLFPDLTHVEDLPMTLSEAPGSIWNYKPSCIDRPARVQSYEKFFTTVDRLMCNAEISVMIREQHMDEFQTARLEAEILNDAEKETITRPRPLYDQYTLHLIAVQQYTEAVIQLTNARINDSNAAFTEEQRAAISLWKDDVGASAAPFIRSQADFYDLRLDVATACAKLLQDSVIYPEEDALVSTYSYRAYYEFKKAYLGFIGTNRERLIRIAATMSEIGAPSADLEQYFPRILGSTDPDRFVDPALPGEAMAGILESIQPGLRQRTDEIVILDLERLIRRFDHEHHGAASSCPSQSFQEKVIELKEVKLLLSNPLSFTGGVSGAMERLQIALQSCQFAATSTDGASETS